MYKWHFFNKYDPQRTTYKHYIVSKLVTGQTLDIGFSQYPNKYLTNCIGLDIVKAPCPHNYKEVHVQDVGNESLLFKKESFDSIIALDLIEHVENPSHFLRECHRLLKPEGKLIISTPQATHWTVVMKNYLFLNAPYWDKKGEHISNWDRITMNNFLKKMKFKLLNTYGVCFKLPGTCFALPCKMFPSLSWIVIYETKKSQRK